jgi:hypothetical protein
MKSAQLGYPPVPKPFINSWSLFVWPPGSVLRSDLYSRVCIRIDPHISGYIETLSSGLKRPEREAIHSAPSIAEVKSAWNYNFTPLYTFRKSYLLRTETYLHYN